MQLFLSFIWSYKHQIKEKKKLHLVGIYMTRNHELTKNVRRYPSALHIRFNTFLGLV